MDVESRFRLHLRGRDATSGAFKEEVDYDGQRAIIDGRPVYATLQSGIPYTFDHDGVPSILHQDAGTNRVYYSVQRGINTLWLTAPNPLTTQSVKAYESNGTTALDCRWQGDRF
jgi:hypothetical protein